MERRTFMGLLGSAIAAPASALGVAQAQDRPVRIGVLSTGTEFPVTAAGYPSFIDELKQLGFVEGRNLVIDLRPLSQGPDAAQKLLADAADLVRAKSDVIVTFGSENFVQAAIAASPAIPIVMAAYNFDPIARGYVKSLARPGGNITGVTFRQPELASKQIELLREAFPDRTALAVLYDEQSADQFSSAEQAAHAMGLRISGVKLENPPYDFTGAFNTLARDGAQMVLVLSSGHFSIQRMRIAERAIAHRLPTMFIFKPYVMAGGLMSYGVDYLPSFRRAGEYAAKILKGAKPADLPVEQVTAFELVVNLKTAKALGLEMPTSILLRANTVIE